MSNYQNASRASTANSAETMHPTGRCACCGEGRCAWCVGSEKMEFISEARVSACGKYRYTLRREWDRSLPCGLVFIMLNPSTADHAKDDPTIRKCIGFAKRMRFGGFTVVNLFALRATDPAELSKVDDPVGPGNDDAIFGAVGAADYVIAAWGAKPIARKRAYKLLQHIMFRDGVELWCLDKSKDGAPKHPLFVPYAEADEPLRWKGYR